MGQNAVNNIFFCLAESQRAASSDIQRVKLFSDERYIHGDLRYILNISFKSVNSFIVSVNQRIRLYHSGKANQMCYTPYEAKKPSI